MSAANSNTGKPNPLPSPADHVPYSGPSDHQTTINYSDGPKTVVIKIGSVSFHFLSSSSFWNAVSFSVLCPIRFPIPNLTTPREGVPAPVPCGVWEFWPTHLAVFASRLCLLNLDFSHTSSPLCLSLRPLPFSVPGEPLLE